jgi:diaminohydroxyphosphoribosylaminopyrimidine deaminase/5-amino-6-(5-phosphoribosylamino)uracil reductase
MATVPNPEVDTTYMRRAIRLAMNGRGRVEPNPMVGCVIVKNDRVIGEGYHQQFGGPHAEPNALASCVESPAGATAYVTLEPCCHTNKKTPPCAPALIAAKIGRVVVGCLDPNPEVNGNGLRLLREAGIEVDGPLLEAEAKQLIAPFLARVNQKRPYVTLKWAETADGRIAGPGGRRMQISNHRSSGIVQELRARCDAIVIGINTVLTDDPLLTARGIAGARPLRRYVLDRHLRIPLESRLVQTARQVSTVVGCDVDAFSGSKRQMLLDEGVEVLPMPWLERLMVDLYCRYVTHAVVEPGPILARAFFDEGKVDRLWVIQSPKSAGEDSGPTRAAIPQEFVVTGELNADGDRLIEFLNPRSAAYFAPVPSADFVLTRDNPPLAA